MQSKLFKTLARIPYDAMRQVLFNRFHETSDTGFQYFNLEYEIHTARRYKNTAKYDLIKQELKSRHWTARDYLTEEKNSQ